MSERYVELIVEGPELLLRGLVTGTLATRQSGSNEVQFAIDVGVRSDGLFEQVAEWMRLQRNVSHLLVAKSALGDIRKALSAAEKQFGVAVGCERQFERAWFPFSYTAYKKESADAVEAVLRSVPDVELEDYERSVNVDEDAKGGELYSPVHAFEVHARGVAKGPFAKVVELHRALCRRDLVHAEKVELEYIDE